MQVTIGQYEYTLDPKNRLVAPPRYRESLEAEKGRHFILSLGLDHCIWLFTPSQWERFLVSATDTTKSIKDKQKSRAAKRLIYSTAVEAELDEQGRILIPQNLKEHAGLGKDVMIAGAGDKAEIWDLARWKSYVKKEAAPSFAKLAKELDL